MRRDDHSTWRVLAAHLAVFGLLCQAALSGLFVPVAFASADPLSDAAGYRIIVICSGDGMKRITLDPDGNPVDEQPAGSHEDCLLCVVCCQGAPLMASPPLVPAPSTTFRARPQAYAHIFIQGRHPLARPSRGPPLPV